MQLYAITIEATAQRTITLAAATLEEAQAVALNIFNFPVEMMQLDIVEAAQLEGAV